MARQAEKPSTDASGKAPTKASIKTKTPEKAPATIPVVGLAASDGGLQAFTAFFEAMRDDTGMAFVVIHHAGPDQKNLQASLLARHTKMNVSLVQDNTPIAPDHVYIIPPDRFLSIEDGVFRLAQPALAHAARLPIDFFLRSLAKDQHQNAVAVILSGTGGNGTAGIRSIKENGGMVLVQDPAEAVHDGMPRSAIASGAVDRILPVEKMPSVIVDYTEHPFVVRSRNKKISGEKARGALAEIISALKVHTPIDFENYKKGTLLRRIERRMALHHLEHATEYLSLLKSSPAEAQKLCADFLICVTSFFRDPEAFAYLANHVVHDLVENCPSGQPIRIWVPACATGEEAYSLAMLVIEQIETLGKDVKLQIFASDVDEQALATARAGVYPDAIAGDVSPERLKRFFDKEDHCYRVKAELRDAVVFTHQNILADPPFSKLDLISCRNLLIYLNAGARERVIQMFHFALNDGGLLLLGSSETAKKHGTFFEPESTKNHLYRRTGKARRQNDTPVAKPSVVGHSGEDITNRAFATKLEQDLDATRLKLRKSIQEYERTTDGLNGANEEFQSTNEELEASKEELQSLNEELTTLNTQLQHKIEDTRRLTDDLNNLLSSSGIATLFLDRSLNIMRFTPATRELFNVTASDVGRPFSNIESKLDDPALLTDAASVLEDLKPLETQVQAGGNKWFIRRILPYQTHDLKIEGVVITFADVTDLKALQQSTQSAQKFAEAIVSTVREPMLVLNKDLLVVKASLSFLKTFQTTTEETEGKALFEIQDRQWAQSTLRDLLERVLPDKTSVEGHEIKVNVAKDDIRTMLVNARAVLDDQNSRTLILLALEDVTDRIEIERGLKDREARLRAILDAAPEAIITADDNGIVTSYSPSAKTILGFRAEEVVGQNVSMLMPAPHREKHDGYMSHYMHTGEKRIIGTGRELTACHKDGSDVPIRLTVAEWWIDGKRNFTGILHDLTEDMKRRDALQRAQKMEAVGQLTGGLAHDFNNLLTVIIGNLELLEMRLGEFPQKELLTEALEASDLGAKLTTQLLAFSRKQALIPAVMSLNELVLSLKPLLKRTLGDNISIETDLADDLKQTLTDPGQVENAILNLAINARDAMDEGGSLTIETRNVVLDTDYAETQVDVKAGSYVALSVTDTGTGMSTEVVSHAFEPFFTTKGVGAGSGLGLSMVYGFAKQTGGHAAIYSEEGVGTTVTLYLPPSTLDQTVSAPSGDIDISPSWNETILVVEDDPPVQRLTVNRLENLGYHAIAAENGPDALEILRTNEDISLVLSDVVMPGGMTGFDVADQALTINPSLKILLATGYASGAEIGRGPESQHHPVLRKPYSLKDLSTALRDLLD